MPGMRRKFRREGEAQRQGDLIAAALDLMAEGGPQAATVRAIAERAGVTPGLIRHYFRTKEDLLSAAYAHFVEAMTADHRAILNDAPKAPVDRLAQFVAGALRPPLTDARAVGIWAGFLHLVQREPGLKQIHRTGYHAFRGELEVLIADVLIAQGRPLSPDLVAAEATAVNALIDGLWLEGSILPEDFGEDALARLGLEKIGALLGISLQPAQGGQE